MKNIKLENEKTFRDPVHDLIRVQDSLILDLINSVELQRLRRIKQLSILSNVFHGAEHSRFSHSLGVYEIARRVNEHLEWNYFNKNESHEIWDSNDKLLFLCTALLHDIGHGPYSHTFENVFKTNHEEYTKKIIQSPETEINKILIGHDEDLPNKIVSVLNNTYKNKQINQLISSQIDVDRMDYLLRDAYYTGAIYGRFDLSRIIQMIKPKSNTILFDFKSMNTIEDYIISRYQMYIQVYFHPVSISMEVILKSIIKRAKYLYNENKLIINIDVISRLLDDTFDLKDYLRLDDFMLMTIINEWQYNSDNILSDLSKRFLNRKPFKSIIINNDQNDLIKEIGNIIIDNGYDLDYYAITNNSFKLSYDIYDPKNKKYQKQIELLKSNGEKIELSEVSTIVKSMVGKYYGNTRFFYPENMNKDIKFINFIKHNKLYKNK